MIKNISILGAGFCGVAVAWYLKKSAPHLNVTLIDPNGIGNGASGVSAGLLHTFGGARAKLSRFGREAYQETIHLLGIAGTSVYKKTGIYRKAMSDEQMLAFKKSAELYDDVHLESDGILISSGIVVDTRTYLNKLWSACEQLGIKFSYENISSDLTIYATGANTKALLPELPLRLIKGQTLTLKWPDALEPLKVPINSKAYLICHGKTATLGATFEREFKSWEPDIAFASKQLLPHLEKMFPDLLNAEIISCNAGIRVAAPDHLPLVKRLDQKHFVITGMGSKGLLYHAYYAKALCRDILAAQ
ncbi:MAG: FAD-dependent oxidoreductase [Waddliaceae bacterium]